MPDQPETFDKQTWQERIKQRLQSWKRPASYSLYGFLSAMSLFPVVEALQRGQYEALAALGVVTAGIGTGLLTNLVQEWARGKKSWEEIMHALEPLIQQNQELRGALGETSQERNSE